MVPPTRSSILSVVTILSIASAPTRVAGDDKAEAPEPQAVDFVSDDSVVIAGTYFPSPAGKESPVVMLLHMLGRRQRDYDDLAYKLQDSGCAVLTFDFRGHGYSRDRINWTDLRTARDLETMLADIEAAKRFLLERHNAGELNISKLAIVGAELGSSLALKWAWHDCQRPPMGFYGRQGQDVRALVLLSPEWNFKGLLINDVVSGLQDYVPMLIVVGANDSNAKSQAERLYEVARRGKLSGEATQLQLVETRRQGTKLLDPELDVIDSVVKFLNTTLKKSGPRWEGREVAAQ